METLYINKENIFSNFDELSNVWDKSTSLSLCLNISIPDFEAVVTELLRKPLNDLAFSILSEIAEKDGLNEELMRLIYNHGDKGCKVAIALRNDLPADLKILCEHSDDADIREHYMNKL